VDQYLVPPDWFIPHIPSLLITALVWITYGYTLRCGFVIDDIQAIVGYDGKLQGIQYGMIFRWIRYHLCGGNFQSKVQLQDKSFLPQGKVPNRHHALSVIIFNLACIALYYFLQPIIGTKLTALTVAMFIVHPVCTQGVAWISGLGYPLGILWMSLSFILVRYLYEHPTPELFIIGTVAFCLLQFLSIHAQFATMMSWAILAFLGYWPFAALAMAISGFMGFNIIRTTILMRKDEFKKQQMGGSTFLKPRKFVVAMKTLAYYIKHSILPHRMGLYHDWGFHYDKSIEREDKRFFIGLLFLVISVCVFFKIDCVSIKLGLLWFGAFSVIFWNWITIQQFVTERYIMIASIGTCMIVSTLLQDFLALYAVVFGLALMRTWTQLPAYDNLIKFYQSNIWNFERSEVAYGNLGVTYMETGLTGTALECWQIAHKINPDYDVPIYNIFSSQRSNAMAQIQNGNFVGGFEMLKSSMPTLERVLQCKICHFPDSWKKELQDLKSSISNPRVFFGNELTRLVKLLDELKKRASDPNEKDINGVVVSVNNISAQCERLRKFMEQSGLTLDENITA